MEFTLSPDQKGIETVGLGGVDGRGLFTLSPDQKGIETTGLPASHRLSTFTLSPDQKGIETGYRIPMAPANPVHTEPRSKGD